MKAYRCVCGAKPVVKKIDPYDGDYIVKCNSCGIVSPSMGRDEDDAIESWNRFIRRILDRD